MNTMPITTGTTIMTPATRMYTWGDVRKGVLESDSTVGMSSPTYVCTERRGGREGGREGGRGRGREKERESLYYHK